MRYAPHNYVSMDMLQELHCFKNHLLLPAQIYPAPTEICGARFSVQHKKYIYIYLKFKQIYVHLIFFFYAQFVFT
jgi:hypothetical protein